MKLTIRSRVLIYLGTLIYGNPKNFGINCSPEEFYCLPNERSATNPIAFHPLNAHKWENMRRALFLDLARRRAFKHITYVATAAAIVIFTGGFIATATIVKGKELVSSAQARMKTKDEISLRILAIQKEAKKLADDVQSGKISKEEYLLRAKELQNEFDKLEESK
ncbi:hypothetical protein [Diaphorobacter aerolatus]|uniref:Uncharacterized protein n=1 Tax=Diaphorobacter aerolatus TaxID=1288495 RepID=A0A7H0GJA5_9BURK|nr:hypothetical protein [Diaphorobacter aerolatus]QNP48371.1 hypothetical protein H9K75_20850 [Diaphorobacter aerolatus]